MPLYFLNLHNRIGFVPDESGVDLSSLAEAREQAIANIRSIVSEDVRNGLIDLNGRIEIASRDGRVLDVVSFSTAFELQLDHSH